MLKLDATHDPKRRSWVESANVPGCDFPIQNLPFGVFKRRGSDGTQCIGVAIGDQVLDVERSIESRLLAGISSETANALCAETLNPFMELGPEHWKSARIAIAGLLDAGTKPHAAMLVPQKDAEMFVPSRIGDYTDFYASIHHATNVGSMFRPDNPLLPNYKHLPVGYHGRASSIVVSGTPVRRPMGQIVSSDAGPPEFAACKLLDYEMELGFFIGPGNELGTRIPMRDAANHIFGLVIVNDWSARDIQKWEYQPLGPFNAKNFATTISPWVVTMEALEPFRVPGPMRLNKSDPAPLEYLQPVDDMGFDITVEVWLSSAMMREKGIAPMVVSRGSFAEMYWTIAQMLVHHTSSGCNLQPGDLLASGTISGSAEESRGCLLERTWRGQNPLSLPDGTARKFLQDNDLVSMRAFCSRPGVARIGFGDCVGEILQAG